MTRNVAPLPDVPLHEASSDTRADDGLHSIERRIDRLEARERFEHSKLRRVPQIEVALARIQDIVKREKIRFESVTTEAVRVAR